MPYSSASPSAISISSALNLNACRSVPPRFSERVMNTPSMPDTLWAVTCCTFLPSEMENRCSNSAGPSSSTFVQPAQSENPADTLYFTHKQTATLTYNEVVKKDTVVYHGGDRYHCYVYVNPSRLKVRKTNYTDEGIAVENVYYDNVIHICVYKGRTCLFSRDYSKKSFTGMVPESFLGQAILSNMEFDRADRDGCHFNATVCIPDDAGCYMVGICVDYAGKPEMELLEY